MISLLQFSHCTIWRVKSLLITLLCVGFLAQGKPIDSGISMIDASTDSTTVDSTLAKQTDSSGGADWLLRYGWLTSDGPKIEHPDGRISFEIVQNGGKKISDTKASLRAAPLSTLDYQPLMDLYNGTNGPNWTNHTGWGSGTDPCTGNNGSPWFGLTCDNGRVSKVSLTNNNLVGSLPGSLSMLTGLTVIQINQNSQLSGSIPTGLGNLTSLFGLELDNNALTGSIPTELSMLTNLLELNLHYNRLTGGIPSNLPTSLQMLDLQHNQLTGSLPANLLTMINIQSIVLSANQLTGTIPGNLSALTSLLNFNVSGNQLTGNIPTGLPASLQGFELQDNKLTGTIPTNLSKNIERLNLYNNQLTGGIPTNLNTLTKLTEINLHNNQLTGGIPTNLPTSLRFLNLNSNQLTGNIPATLGALPNLTDLNLSVNQLSGCFPASLTALCGAGRSANLSNNPGLPGAGDFDTFCNTGVGKDGFLAQASADQPEVCVQSVVSLSANGGSGYTYNWISPAGATLSGSSSQTVSATLTTSGVKTFTVVISSGLSCSSTATLRVTSNGLPTARLESNGILTCADPSVRLTATGGTSYTFVNSSGEVLAGSGNILTVTTPGTYSVMVGNANGCVSTTSTTVLGDTDPPTATILAPASSTITCTTTSLSLTATGGGTYRWDNNTTNAIRTVTAAGSYSVTVRAPNGCTAVATQVIMGNTDPPTADILAPASSTITCTTTSLSLTATGGGTYRWDNNTTNAIRTVTAAGTYSVTVRAPNGCTTVATQVIMGNTATISVSNPSTTTANQGTFFSQTFLASGGLTPRSFDLASGSLPDGLSLSTTGVLSGTPTQGGSFTITVRATDANGCSGIGASYVMTVADNTPIITDFAAVNTSMCVGSPFTFTATISNVTGTYNYTLTNGINLPSIGTKSGAAFSLNLTPSGSGNQSYTLVIRDNGQSASAIANITVSPFPIPSLTNNGPVSCTMTTVTLTASGGTSYTFTMGGVVVGTPGSSNTLNVTTAGGYAVRVANATGCASTTTTTVGSIVATVTVDNPTTANGVKNAAFSQDFSAQGGTSPRRFSVASGSLPTGLNLSTTGVLSGTPTQSGSFPITVRATDINGCSGVGASYVLTIVNNTPIIDNFAAVSNVVCSGSPFTFTATVSNVTGTYSYTLTNGINTPTSGTKTSATFSQSLTSVGSGSQSFTLVISDNSQSAFVTTDVIVNSLPTPSLTNNGPISCTLPAVTLTALGGNSYTFTTSGGIVVGIPGTANTVDVTTSGTYTVRVANATGCVSTTTTNVTGTIPTITVTNPATKSGTANVAFSQNFTASGGTAPRSFSMVSGRLPDGLSLASTGNLSGIPTEGGSFTIAVGATDANGCSGVGAAYILAITDNTPTIADFAAVNSSVCVGSTVTFTATVGNVSGSYTYTLTNGSGTPSTGTKSGAAFSLNETTAGAGIQSFTLTVRDNNQSSTAATDVLVSSFPVPGLTNNGPISCTMTTVTLTASGGNSYTFTLGGTVVGSSGSANTLDVTVAGTYTVRVANESGCASTTTTTVTSNTAIPALTVSPTSATLTNANPSTTLTASGTGSLLWSTGQTTPMISVTTSGNYSVTLTGANGCKATANVPVRGSDLTANILLPQAQFGASGTAAVGNFVVNVFEVGGLPTSSGNVTITVTAPIGYTIAFPASLTSIDVQNSGTVNVNNGQWTVTKSLANRQLSLTMNSGTFISGGGESSLGFTLTRTSANSGSTSSITVNVADDLTMTYDGNLSNNVYARIISGL
ncbi:putative Ig domain-containing protein [Spirosoma foliorum]|uniref:Putative Ig domain-containing protein n=1 Tax=Spirosoma foliorum TaxID=2710596 RepID=A0A7G5GPK3_9BACT|nr:putative Ig domain-containing protein [Spirosoma foliorum]QMW00795.1 putative Ig domain-containing protein [Spirosoma foliorum]